MILVTALDADFVELTGVMLASLSAANLALISEVYVLSDGLSDEDRRCLQSCIGKPLAFIDVAQQLRLELPLDVIRGARFPPSACARLFIPDLIKSENERILYIDGDTIVLGALDDLAHLDLEGKPVAAVATRQRNLMGRRARLGLSSGSDYLNSGVLLIDPKCWRKQDLTAKLIDFLRTFDKPLGFPDQDALNVVLAGNWLRLPRRWNMRKGDYIYFTNRANDIRIAHFTGRHKPNQLGCPHPSTADFLRVRARTVFASQPLKPDDAPVRRLSFRPLQRVLLELLYWGSWRRLRPGEFKRSR